MRKPYLAEVDQLLLLTCQASIKKSDLKEGRCREQASPSFLTLMKNQRRFYK
jgi:hypothetical protein